MFDQEYCVLKTERKPLLLNLYHSFHLKVTPPCPPYIIYLINYNNVTPVTASVKTLSNIDHITVCTTQGSRNELMTYKKDGLEGSEACWRSELGAKGSSFASPGG